MLILKKKRLQWQRVGVGELQPAGHMWPNAGLSPAHKSLQQIQNKNQQIFAKAKVKWPETLVPLNCLCWIMIMLVFINHAVYILHYLRVHHLILKGAAFWCFMAHWCGPHHEKFTHHWLRGNKGLFLILKTAIGSSWKVNSDDIWPAWSLMIFLKSNRLL